MVAMEMVVTSLLLLTALIVARGSACPASCSCPSAANQVTCVSANLTSIPRDIPRSTSILDLSRNFLEHVGDLSWLRNVVSLKLGDNMIQSVEEGALQSMVDLQTLDLSNNRLALITDKSLVGSEVLMHLDLSNNLLRHIDGAFSAKRELSRLDLSHNQIQRLTQFTFRDLKKLRYLLMMDNEISHIDKRAFRNLEKLMYLVLKGNPIHRVTKFEFTSQVLSYVDLSECGLEQIPRGLPSTIRYLQLRRNNLSEIHRRSFRDCPHVSILVLDENSIADIDDHAFEDMEYLQQLWLNGNRLNHVPHPLPVSLQRLLMDQNRVTQLNDVFPENSQLQTLSIMGNNLSYLSFDSFSKLTQLVSLDLSNNKLSHLYGHTFINQNKLKTLQLSKNPLTHFHSRCLWGLSSLSTLSLAYIQTAVSIHPDTFDHVSSLQHLDLNSSPWVVRTLFSGDAHLSKLSSVVDLSMQSCELITLRPDFPSMFAHLKTLHISSTRWHCDKSMIWLRSWLLNTKVDVINKQDITCFTPRSVHGRLIVSLTESEFAEVTTRAHTTTTTTRPLSTFPTTSSTVKAHSSSGRSTGQIHDTAVTTGASTVVTYQNGVEDYSQNDDNSDPYTSIEFSDPFSDDSEDSHMTWEEYLNKSLLDKSRSKVPTSETRHGSSWKHEADTPSERSPKDGQTTRKSPSKDKIQSNKAGSNTTTIIIIVVTIATVIIAAVIITLIVYLTRKQRNQGGKDSGGKNGNYRNGIKYNHKNDVLYFMPNGTAKKEGSTSDSIKTNSTSKEQMTLIPGRDINHEGPLRVYKWEDF